MTNLSRRFIIASSAAILGLALASPGPARAQQGDAARLNSVQQQQKQEIREGADSSKLNKKEAAKLAKQEKNIRTLEARDRAKGPLTNAEANQLKQATQRENAEIKHAEAHNGRAHNR